MLPQQSINIKVPLQDDTKVIVEPRIENSNQTWPPAQLCTVKNGEISIENSSDQPAHIKSKYHHFQLRTTEENNFQDKTC